MPELSGRLCMQPVAEKKKIAVLCGSNHKPHNMNVAVCRVKEAGERTYHIVFSPGNGLICRDTQDYILFQNFIAFAVLRDGCMLLAYAVMSTHAHIAVVTAWPWSFIHRLRTSYTTYFNKKYRRKGSVCGKQVYCMPVDGWYAQKALVSYILRNPMHHGVAGTPFGYRHTSLGAYFRKELSMADTQRDTSEDGNPGFDEHPGLNGNPGPRGCPRSKPKEDPGSKGKSRSGGERWRAVLCPYAHIGGLCRPACGNLWQSEAGVFRQCRTDRASVPYSPDFPAFDGALEYGRLGEGAGK